MARIILLFESVRQWDQDRTWEKSTHCENIEHEADTKALNDEQRVAERVGLSCSKFKMFTSSYFRYLQIMAIRDRLRCGIIPSHSTPIPRGSTILLCCQIDGSYLHSVCFYSLYPHTFPYLSHRMRMIREWEEREKRLLSRLQSSLSLEPGQPAPLFCHLSFVCALDHTVIFWRVL